jgi:2,3,4,5-tetrahydropyridine-2-carboxylate N-succinyltransferase
MHPIQHAIEQYADMAQLDAHARKDARRVFLEFRDALTRGEIRAAEELEGRWHVNVWVKRGILLGFRLGELEESGTTKGLTFVDKDTFPARTFSIDDGVRVVPGGSRCVWERSWRRRWSACHPCTSTSARMWTKAR